MFFVLSKLLYFLLNPVCWIVILLLLRLVFKKPVVRKRLLIAASILFLLFSNKIIFKAVVLAWQPPVEHKTYIHTYSSGILLCGLTMSDKHRQVYFNENADRFIQAIRLYHTGVVKKLFISGGDGSLKQNKPKEADFLRAEMVAQGIPASDIIIENQSRNTYESAMAAKPILDSLQLKPPYVLVSSATHLRRAAKTFEKAGIAVELQAAGYEAIETETSWTDYFMPSLHILDAWQPVIKEMVGLLTYQMTGKA